MTGCQTCALPSSATVPAFKPKNSTLYTNRFGLDMHIKATQNVVITTRLLMYKTFGANDANAVTNAGSAPFFADSVGVFDGTRQEERGVGKEGVSPSRVR